ncbi:hypothetical protein [uncultured Sneathiella sp.]|uniref:hypothetical protein n=1 Tax=uncultured Sneathiella sp. TaxID=879315 RepID=UPI0030EEDA20|tara:strand:+ start:14963 stop:15160 length:198 start_codon:yes stop_codon:yes gene_type:complete
MREIREIHDLTGRVAAHYMEKYGAKACDILEEAARQCEEKWDLTGRNRLLRLRDEILISEMQNAD